jgi:hypothetical protein
MQLFFDTYEAGKDVRKMYTDILDKMMMVEENLRDGDSDRGRPPYCRLCWGKVFSFKCVVVSLNLEFTMFLPDGTPVRATANLTLKEIAEEEEPQNPSSVSRPGNRIWTVKPGETIDWIAYKTLGNAFRWRTIAEANDLLDPLALTPGQQLTIPPKP